MKENGCHARAFATSTGRGSFRVHLLMRDNPPPPDKAGGLSEGVVVGEEAH